MRKKLTDYFDFERAIPKLWILVIITGTIIAIGWVLNILAWNAIPSPYSILDNEAAFYEALERNAFYNEMTGYVLYSLFFPLIGAIYVLIRAIRWGKIIKREKEE